MKIKREIARVYKNKKIRGEITNISATTKMALLGDPIAESRLKSAYAKGLMIIKEEWLWMKMERFLEAIYESDEEGLKHLSNQEKRRKLAAKLTEDGKKGDNPARLLECIERIDGLQKIDYIINATCCLLVDYIDLTTFFRVINAVSNTLQEDLLFLKDHIGEKYFTYSFNIQGLLTNGLMDKSSIDSEGNQTYDFTPVALLVDRYAVSYRDVDRYPNPLVVQHFIDDPRLKLPLPKWEPIPEKDLKELFK